MYSYDAPPPALPPSSADKSEPYARVKRLDEKRWSVTIIHGTSQYGPHPSGGWIVKGPRGKAEMKARKELADYVAKRRLQEDEFIVTLNS